MWSKDKQTKWAFTQWKNLVTKPQPTEYILQSEHLLREELNSQILATTRQLNLAKRELKRDELWL